MRQIIYDGDLGELLAKYHGRFAGRDQECAALVQAITAIGYTSRWQPGPRVVDQTFIKPGTIIANFKIENGRARYPNQSGWHVAIFSDFGNRRPGGGYTHFWIVDQWRGRTVGRRRKQSWTPEEIKRNNIKPVNDAEQYYIVNVP